MAAVTTQVLTSSDSSQVTMTINGTAYTWTAQQFRSFQKLVNRGGTNIVT